MASGADEVPGAAATFQMPAMSEGYFGGKKEGQRGVQTAM